MLFGLILIVAVTGCAQLKWPRLKPAPDIEETAAIDVPQPAGSNAGHAVPAEARTIDDFDTTSQTERLDAQNVEASIERDLGTTIASLGSPTEPGFWLKTPLVDAPGKGRVDFQNTGKSVEVDLIPIDGPKTAGSRMSLAALRLLDAPLAGLPEVQVFLLNK